MTLTPDTLVFWMIRPIGSQNESLMYLSYRKLVLTLNRDKEASSRSYFVPSWQRILMGEIVAFRTCYARLADQRIEKAMLRLEIVLDLREENPESVAQTGAG